MALKLKREDFKITFVRQGVYKIVYTSSVTGRVYTQETENYYLVNKIMGVANPPQRILAEMVALAKGKHTQYFNRVMQTKNDKKSNQK
jgi:hypothetical protein